MFARSAANPPRRWSSGALRIKLTLAAPCGALLFDLGALCPKTAYFAGKVVAACSLF